MTVPALLLAGSIAAAGRPLPAPTGRWSITSTFSMGGLPLAPPPRRFDRCVTERDRDDPRALLSEIAAPGDDCRVDAWSADGKTVRWTAECAGRYRGPAEGSLTFSGDAAAGEFTIRIEDARGAPHPVRYRIEVARREDCSP
jgi:hypothetical protein